MFSCENLSCERGGRLIFENLGFSMQEGSLLLIKGANGSGKTTLIKLLCGLIAPKTGKILWKDKSIAGNADFKHDLMMIGSKTGVKSDATVLENLEFWGKIFDTEMLIPAALAFYDLGKFADVPAAHLSSGWQRRVALARLIISPCKVWMLDEPTNFLDDEAVVLTANLIEARVKQGGIVIAASHIMNSAIPAHNLFMEDFVPIKSQNI